MLNIVDDPDYCDPDPGSGLRSGSRSGGLQPLTEMSYCWCFDCGLT